MGIGNGLATICGIIAPIIASALTPNVRTIYIINIQLEKGVILCGHQDYRPTRSFQCQRQLKSSYYVWIARF